MTKRKSHKQHIIHWNSNAHTIVRGSAEPYDILEEYKPTKVGPFKDDPNFKDFTISDKRWDEKQWQS